MSLLERSQKTLNPNLTKGQINNIGFSKVASNSKTDLSILQNQVNEIISTDKLAKYISTNPRRAQAEIRNAAYRCFANPKWLNYSDEEKKKLLNDLIDLMFGFGPIEILLDNPKVTEIMVNGIHSIYYEQDGKLFRSSQHFNSDEQVRALIDRILGPLGRRIDEASPMVNARLSAGHRVHAIIPPLSLDGTILTIRKFAEHVITLEEMMKTNSIDKKILEFLKWAVLLKKNIAVSGGTGSGKTTLLNALSCKIPHAERVITIEDSAELRFLEHPHVVRLEARPRNAEGSGEVSIRDLVINALRMRPDRIVVGECRGAEALDMLQAMNTGHDGSLTTLHANSPVETISRLTTMVRYAAELPVDVIENYIASAIDLVIQTTRGIDGSRYVSNIVSFYYDEKEKQCKTKQLFYRGPFEKFGKWINFPDWLSNVVEYKFATNEEVKTWKLAS